MNPERLVRIELAVLGAAMAIGCCAEAALRLGGRREGAPALGIVTTARLTAPDPDLGYAMRPGLDVWIRSASDEAGYIRYRSDARGFRNPPLTDTGRPLVVLTGACTMQELGTSTPDGFGPCVDRLERLLADGGWPSARVANAAVGGYDLGRRDIQYQRHLKPLRPDAVVLEADAVELFEGSPAQGTPPPSPALALLVRARQMLSQRSLALDALLHDGAAWEAGLRRRLGFHDAAPPPPLPRDRAWAEAYCRERLAPLVARLRRDGIPVLVQPVPTWLRSREAAAGAGLGHQAEEVLTLDQALAAWCVAEGIPLVPPEALPADPEDFLRVKGQRSSYILGSDAQRRRAALLALHLAPMLRQAHAGP